MSPYVITREGVISFEKDVFDPYPFRQGFLLVWRAHAFLFGCLLPGGRRGWILVHRALLPVMSWFNGWCGDSLGFLKGEVHVIVIGNNDLCCILWVNLEHELVVLAPSLVQGFMLGDLPFACWCLQGHARIVRQTQCLRFGRYLPMTPHAILRLEWDGLCGYFWLLEPMNVAHKAR